MTLLNKTINIVLDENPARVTFAHEITEIQTIRHVYFRLSGIDPANIPTHLYLKIDDESNIRPQNSINSVNLSTGNNFVRATSSMIPLHFELAGKYNDGTDPDSQYPIIFGIQHEDICWQAHDVSSLKSFRVSIIGVDGSDYVMPPGAVLQLVFSVKYWTGVPVGTPGIARKWKG